MGLGGEGARWEVVFAFLFLLTEGRTYQMKKVR